LEPRETDSYKIFLEIIEFYRIQPKIGPLQIEKIEEYLTLMSAHYQNFSAEIEDCIGLEEPIELEKIIDVLNSYLSIVGEELAKIFPEEINDYSPICLSFSNKLNEIQAIELYKNMNGNQNNQYGISEDLDKLEESVYESNFSDKFAILTQKLMGSINSDLIVKVEDLV
jgi:hypothetical protein